MTEPAGRAASRPPPSAGGDAAILRAALELVPTVATAASRWRRWAPAPGSARRRSTGATAQGGADRGGAPPLDRRIPAARTPARAGGHRGGGPVGDRGRRARRRRDLPPEAAGRGGRVDPALHAAVDEAVLRPAARGLFRASFCAAGSSAASCANDLDVDLVIDVAHRPVGLPAADLRRRRRRVYRIDPARLLDLDPRRPRERSTAWRFVNTRFRPAGGGGGAFRIAKLSPASGKKGARHNRISPPANLRPTRPRARVNGPEPASGAGCLAGADRRLVARRRRRARARRPRAPGAPDRGG